MILSMSMENRVPLDGMPVWTITPPFLAAPGRFRTLPEERCLLNFDLAGVGEYKLFHNWILLVFQAQAMMANR